MRSRKQSLTPPEPPSRYFRASTVLVRMPAVMGPTMPMRRRLTDMNRPYLWCLSVKSASNAAGTWKEREETRAQRKTPYHISVERRAVRRARGLQRGGRRAGPAPSRPRGGEGTWEGGERTGVGGGAVAHAGHQAEAEDLLQEAPAAARLAALHPLSGPAAAIRRLLFRLPPSARSSQWEAPHGDRQFSPPTAARQGASGPPRPVPIPTLPWERRSAAKNAGKHPGNGSSPRRAGRCRWLLGRSSLLAAISSLLPVLGAAYRGSAVFQPARGRPGSGGDSLGRGGDTLGRGGRA